MRAQDSLADFGMVGVHVGVHLQLPALYIGHGDFVNIAVSHGEETHDLLVQLKRLILGLFESFLNALAAIELALGGRVEIGAELGKGGELAELAELQFQAAGDAFHGPGLGGTADAG